jgi:hypothetical protein
MYTLLLHIANEDPVVAEVDEMPEMNAMWIRANNPRRKDNKDLSYLLPEVTSVLYPTWRINFIEIMPGDNEEEIITTVRDSSRR